MPSGTSLTLSTCTVMVEDVLSPELSVTVTEKSCEPTSSLPGAPNREPSEFRVSQLGASVVLKRLQWNERSEQV